MKGENKYMIFGWEKGAGPVQRVTRRRQLSRLNGTSRIEHRAALVPEVKGG